MWSYSKRRCKLSNPCDSGLKEVRSFQPDLIIAIGGGLTMDAAKVHFFLKCGCPCFPASHLLLKINFVFAQSSTRRRLYFFSTTLVPWLVARRVCTIQIINENAF